MKQPRTPMMFTPSLEECRALAVKEGMPEREGDKFFAHFTKVGWVCGKARVPMKSFAGAMMGWRLEWEDRGRMGANGAPEANGKHHPAGMSDAMRIFKQKEYDRILTRMKVLTSYDSHADMPPSDRAEYKKLVARRNELRQELGVLL